MKRGPYKKRKKQTLTENRPLYDRAYYARNREKILRQHRERYMMRKENACLQKSS